MCMIGEQIRKARKVRKLSQAKLGELVGLGQTSINKVETGGTKQPRDLERFAEVLGVTIEYLFSEDDPPAIGDDVSITGKSPEINYEALTHIVDVVDQVLAELGWKWSHGKRALAVSLLYERYQDVGDGAIEKDNVIRYVKFGS